MSYFTNTKIHTVHFSYKKIYTARSCFLSTQPDISNKVVQQAVPLIATYETPLILVLKSKRSGAGNEYKQWIDLRKLQRCVM